MLDLTRIRTKSLQPSIPVKSATSLPKGHDVKTVLNPGAGWDVVADSSLEHAVTNVSGLMI
jgi:hypothetical protein